MITSISGPRRARHAGTVTVTVLRLVAQCDSSRHGDSGRDRRPRPRSDLARRHCDGLRFSHP